MFHRKDLSKKETRDSKQKRKSVSRFLLRRLYHHINGKELSKQHRIELAEKDTVALTYGEVVSESFQQILDYVANAYDNIENGVFVDLGCGSGKAVVCTALYSRSFHKVVGIEIVPPLYNSACLVKQNLYDVLQSVREMNSSESIALQTSSSSSPLSSNRILTKVKKPNVDVDEKYFISFISKILMAENDNHFCKVETLGTKLSQLMGSKIYKQCIKSHKSLKTFLSKHTYIFSLTDEKVSLRRVEVQSELQATQLQVDVEFEDPITSPTATPELISDAGDHTDMNTTEDQLEHKLQPRADDVCNPLKSVFKRISTSPVDEESDRQECIELLYQKNNIQLFHGLPVIDFIQGDLFEYPWWVDADVVYVASLLFSDEMMYNLTTLVYKMKSGAWFITLKPLCLDKFNSASHYTYSEHPCVTANDSTPNSHSELSTGPDECDCVEERGGGGAEEDTSTGNALVTVRLHDEGFFKMSWQMAKVYFYRVS